MSIAGAFIFTLALFALGGLWDAGAEMRRVNREDYRARRNAELAAWWADMKAPFASKPQPAKPTRRQAKARAAFAARVAPYRVKDVAGATYD